MASLKLSMVSYHTVTVLLPLFNLDSFISCFHLTTVARTSNTLLNKSYENRYLCLVPDLRGNAFIFSPLTMMLAMGLSYMVIITLKYVPSVHISLRVFLS